jgi:hypothetical protein
MHAILAGALAYSNVYREMKKDPSTIHALAISSVVQIVADS